MIREITIHLKPPSPIRTITVGSGSTRSADLLRCFKKRSRACEWINSTTAGRDFHPALKALKNIIVNQRCKKVYLGEKPDISILR